MAITYECNLAGGGGGVTTDCYMYDGMLSDKTDYLTVDFIKPLVVGNTYSLSIKKTNTNDPSESSNLKYNEYIFVFDGNPKTISITINNSTHTFIVTTNSLELSNYSGSWYYVWARVYGMNVSFPSDADY